MKYIKDLIALLELLDTKKIYYKLGKVREGTILIEVTVPGERWEIEIVSYVGNKECEVEVERFRSEGIIADETALEELFENFSD